MVELLDWVASLAKHLFDRTGVCYSLGTAMLLGARESFARDAGWAMVLVKSAQEVV